MGGTTYPKPPITEAVIAFHFSDPLGTRERERFQIKVNRDYPRAEELRNVRLTVGPQVSVEQLVSGHKLSSADGLSIVMLMPEQLSTCRLAPYANWDQLITSARANWDDLLTIVSRPRFKTLSTRYFNRIDIPVKSRDKIVDQNQYFNLGIRYPEGDFRPIPATFSMQVVIPSTDGRFQHVVNFGSAFPELIDHASFLLDIDTSTVGELPSRLDDVWSLVNELRDRKNYCFEAFITDDTRKLFQ